MILEKLLLVPTSPGCYLMKNSEGIVIYVGKAKNLKRRLNSYFHRTHTGKTAKLVSEIADFEYVVVGSETESLILEINLIKKYDPKYNILLRDDKSYPYIELTNESVPRLLVVRNVNRKKKNHKYMFGPYPNVTAARNTVNLLNRLYPLRKCTTYSKVPCLYYHIGQCLGYCSNNVSKEKIENMKEEILAFLKGDNEKVVTRLTNEMLEESSKMNYEKAKEIKELIDYIDITLIKQKVEIRDNLDRDIFGYAVQNGYISFQVFFIRGGKILERHSKICPLIDEIDEELNVYISHFYEKDILLPKEILVPDIVDTTLIENYLGVPVKVPQKGIKKELVEMANSNALVALQEKFDLIKIDEEKTVLANEELREKLKLNKLDRIEIFDNAHLFGTYNVSGMVVFKEGKPSKNDYRKFKISIDQNDDYSTMREVIYRRYFRVLKDNLEKPDLILVDGGIGQINVAREVISSLGLSIMVAGLKKDNHHATEALLAFDPIEEVKIDKKSSLFYLLERMQDEVHNFTINYHRTLRNKGSLASLLDNIEGIGIKRKNELLKKYKTVTKLKSLDIDELSSVIPRNVAENLKKYLENF